MRQQFGIAGKSPSYVAHPASQGIGFPLAKYDRTHPYESQLMQVVSSNLCNFLRKAHPRFFLDALTLVSLHEGLSVTDTLRFSLYLPIE